MLEVAFVRKLIFLALFRALTLTLTIILTQTLTRTLTLTPNPNPDPNPKPKPQILVSNIRTSSFFFLKKSLF